MHHLRWIVPLLVALGLLVVFFDRTLPENECATAERLSANAVEAKKAGLPDDVTKTVSDAARGEYVKVLTTADETSCATEGLEKLGTMPTPPSGGPPDRRCRLVQRLLIAGKIELTNAEDRLTALIALTPPSKPEAECAAKAVAVIARERCETGVRPLVSAGALRALRLNDLTAPSVCTAEPMVRVGAESQ